MVVVQMAVIVSEGLDEVRIRRTARFSAWAAAVIGLIVLAMQLAGVFGERPSGMKANAALAAVLIAGALLSAERRKGLSRLLAVVALAVTILTLVENLAAVDLGIDELLVADPTRVIEPGRMAAETAIVFALLSVGALLTSEIPVGRYLATAMMAVTLFVILAYLFGALNVRRAGAEVRMAPETALASFLLSVALLLQRAGPAWTRLLFSDSPAGRLVRRFISAAVGVAFLIGWIRIRGEASGLLDLESGITVSVTANLLILVALVLWWGQRLERDHQSLIERDAALMASDERFRLASMATNDAIYDWDLLHGIRTWNGVMGQRYGYPIVDAGRTGAEWLERVHPEDRERVARGWAAALEGDDQVWRCEYRTIRADGGIDDILERTFIMRNAAGSAIRAIGALTELTAIRQAEAILRNANVELERRVAERTEELRQKTDRLASMNAELEAFSYSVSHDLRAPLRSIDGFSQALIEDNEAQLDDAGRSHLRRIRAATQKMAELIDGLLELSRVSRTALQHVEVDLTAIAEQTIERLREQNPARQVDVSIGPSIVVQGDPRLLRIVMENLLENAWKFTSKREAACIEVGRRSMETTTEVFVRDNGAGFDPQYASNLFGAFQRLHPVSEFPGTGIGLATVQRIITRHGGTLRAEASPGRGATFAFTMGETS